jgi:hypothetical protein
VPPPPPPVAQLAQHIINWRAQRPDAVLNTYWPGDRILFSEKVSRSSHDATDERFNQMHYVRTGQLGLTTRTLCANGSHDEIEWIRVLDGDRIDAEALADAPCLPFVTRAQHRFASALSQPFQAQAQAAPVQVAAVRPIPEWMQRRDDLERIHTEQFTQDSLVILKLKSGRYIRLSDAFEHGYARTADRTQGLEFDEVVLALKGMPAAVAAKNEARLTPNERYMRNAFGNEYLYMTIGRARLRFGLLGVGPNEIAHMIRNPARQCASFLAHFIARARAALA